MGGGPCQLHPGTRVICLGCFLPDLTGKQSSVAGEPTEPPIESVENQRAGALSLLPRLIATHRVPDAGFLRNATSLGRFSRLC